MIGERARWVPWCWLLSCAITAAVCLALGLSGALKPLGPEGATGICLVIGIVLGFAGMIFDAVRWGWL